jgi:D-glucosaminate-6-phosphate ammonia-lyase
MNWLPPNRRSILCSLAALPGLGMLASSKGDAAARVGGGRDVIRELGVRPFINAGGAYTVLTASLMHREVWDAMTVASRQFCPLQDLHDAVGKRIAELTKNEAALVSAIHSRTAMMLFLNMYKYDGKISHAEFARLGKKHNVPMLVDAADALPPVENLWDYTDVGFDLAAFSGGKGIMGPQSAGILVGRKDLIEAGRLNSSPYSDSVCRITKVNKEEMVGMMVALETFVNRDQEAVWRGWEAHCDRIAGYVKGLPGVKTETIAKKLYSAVPHLHISWEYEATGKKPADVVKEPREGSPSIEVSPNSREELIIAVWMLEPGEDRIIGQRVKRILAS